MEKEKKIRVLVVDYEKPFLDRLEKRLSKEGFSVRSASSSEEAIQAATEEFFDVALMEIMMPGMDGLEAQRRLKELQGFLQCIVLTGHGSIESALESGRLDAFRYLLKPVDDEELVRTIHKAYRRKVELQNKAYDEKVARLAKAGLGAKALRTALKDLQKSMGINA